MDFQPISQRILNSTINDIEDNIFDMGEFYSNVPDTRERFIFLGKLMYEKWNRLNQIIREQSQKLIALNKQNYELTCELINLRQKIEEFENQQNSKINLQNDYESLQTPVTSRNSHDENSDPDIVLELNKDIQSKSICKSVSSPAIMTNLKHKESSRFKREFRLFNTKISISHAKRPHKLSTDDEPALNENGKNTLMNRMETRSSLINLFKKPKKEQKPKSKRLSSSLTENLRVFDKDS